jgi:hypothetical protein
MPEVNPAITAAVNGIVSGAKNLAAGFDAKDNISPSGIIIRVLAIIGVFWLYLWLMRQYNVFENKPNIVRISKEATQAQTQYAKSNPRRQGLRQYLAKLKSSGVPASQMCLTNFYVSTANATGIFFPTYNGVASAEAARAAVLAGARGFVLDIWPDVSAGANFGPVIQVVETGSSWRRISLNALPLSSVLTALTQEAFDTRQRPGSDDPLFLYLRFRGSPRSSTYEQTRAALSAALETYRLDASFNNCRAQDRLYTMPITSFFRKVIVFSNTRAEGTSLQDYINVGPRDGIKVDYEVEEARTLTAEFSKDVIPRIKHNLTWIAPFSESPLTEENGYDWERAQEIGIHFCAMNFWNPNDRLKKYLGKPMFGTQSFALKPAKLRHIIEILPDPKQPFDPKWGSGKTAGTLRDPPAIVMPK